MALIKVPVITIKNLIVLLFLVIISFAVGLLGKLIANKPLSNTAQAQCWAAPGGGGCDTTTAPESCTGSCSCACESCDATDASSASA